MLGPVLGRLGRASANSRIGQAVGRAASQAAKRIASAARAAIRRVRMSTNLTYRNFLESAPFKDGVNLQYADKAYDLWRQKKWAELETYFKDNNLNDGWPPNDGFATKPKRIILEPGTKLDRYGYSGGTFVSPEGSSYSGRALSPGTSEKPYTVFEVVKPIEVSTGNAAPWFGENGGAVQHKFDKPISQLLDEGFLTKK